MNKAARALLVVIVVTIVLVSAFQLIPQAGGKGGGTPVFASKPTLNLKEFRDHLKATNPQEKITKVEWRLNTLISSTKDVPDAYETQAFPPESPAAAALMQEITANNVDLVIGQAPLLSTILTILTMVIGPILILGFLYYMIMRSAQAGGNQAMNFGRSKARRVSENTPKVTFEDVAGIDEAKEELFEIVDFLRNTKKYSALGAKVPKGILLTGPPGVGKTHLARAIAGEAGVPFFHISGSDFVEMFVGVGAARVRDLFETAKAHRPSLIFVDEIDAVGRQRGAGLGGGHDEREQTLNQMLVEMDGFDPNSGVIMIAATNRPDVLDPALLRPGRFDRQIVVDNPDAKGREAILKVHAKGKPLESTVDLGNLAKRTPGFTGADLANMLNEGALLAARRNHSRVSQPDLEEALDRVIAGPERKSRIMNQEEREVIAFHEAGHAIIGEVLEHCDPVHKVTILPRGMSLGSTWQIPDTDKHLVSKEELLDDVSSLLGGRVAEELVFNRVWTGASNDLERVTRIARAMVCEYGMSERLGTLALGRRAHNPFLGRDYNDERNYSEDVARQIDEEVRSIVDHCHHRAQEILTQHRGQLDAVVAALLERETLNRDEFLAVMEGRTLEPLPTTGVPPATTGGSAVDSQEKDKRQVGGMQTPPRLEPGTA